MLNSTRGVLRALLLLLICSFGLTAHSQEPAPTFGAIDAYVGM